MSFPPNTRCGPSRPRTERGSALIAVLLLAALVAVIASHLLTRSAQEHRLATRSYYQSAALNLAEAGIEEAMWAANNNWIDGAHGWTPSDDGTGAMVRTLTSSLSLAQGAGEIYLRLDQPASATPVAVALGVVRLPGQLKIVKQLQVKLERRALWANGMVAKGTITFTGNAAVDSYDSDLGPWDATTNRSDQATVATLSTAVDPVVLNSNASIYGFVATGGGLPDVGGNGRIYGPTTPADVDMDPARIRSDFSANLPAATAPTGTPISNLGTVSSSVTLPLAGDPLGPDGRYLYTAASLSINGNDSVSIKGPVDIIVTGNVSVSGNGNLAVGGTGSTNPSLNLYAAATVSIGGNGMINHTNVPINSTIHGTAPDGTTQSISISGNGSFIGTIYAPNADLTLSGNGGNSGAVIGKTINLSGNAVFHYDIRLGQVPSERFFKPISWIELTAPAGSGAALARDNRVPFSSAL